MAITKTEIIGTKILNEINSSNLVRCEYDTETSKFVVEFKNGTKYEYEKVPHSVFSQFRLSESQGKFFSKEISRKYKYTKL
jgi:hypothetical protein